LEERRVATMFGAVRVNRTYVRGKAGDKSKNARLCTVVVMYTLQRRGSKLLGPLNKSSHRDR
jgi:hypothetical protein